MHITQTQTPQKPESVPTFLPTHTGFLQRACACGQHTGNGGECAACRQKREGTLQRVVISPSPVRDVPPIVHEVLRSPGQPLDAATRAFMEPRFGHDFSAVRVHTDAQAAESARAVDALAYTVGRDMVFGAGQYAPGASVGRKLVAHELTHVVQQVHSEGARQFVQRQSDERANVRRDVAFVLSSDLKTDAMAIAPQAQIVSVGSLLDLAQALKKIQVPIGTLFIVGHGAPSGNITFGGTTPLLSGSMTPDQVARVVTGKLSPENAPERVDFRSCNIGQNPKALERYRSAFGAREAIGGTCYLAIEESPSIMINGEKITKTSQLNVKNRAEFGRQLKQLPDKFKFVNKQCILDKSEQGYFQAGGKMIAIATPSTMKGKRDVCYSDLTIETVDPEHLEGVTGCRLVRVVAPTSKGKLEEDK